MAGEWQEVSLAEVALISSGKRPVSLSKEPTADCQIPVIGGGGPSGYTSAALFDGDVLITGRVGTLGKLFAPTEPCWPSDNALVIRSKDTVTNAKFLRYALQNVILQTMGMNRGAANPLITQSDLGRLRIGYPAITEQRAIAHILGTLDDKIELNRRRNQTLEAMARALFKDWFVDFLPVRAKQSARTQTGLPVRCTQTGGPVRAKMEGQEPYLPADLWQLFPDRLDDEGKPEGWELRPVGDFAELKGGKQLERERIKTSGPVPVFGGAGVMGYTEDHNADGFVIAVGRVGAYCGQFFSHRGMAWINNNASLIRQIDEALGEWLFLSLCNADIDVIKKGAAQPFVSNGDIAKLPLVWPGNELVREFSKIVIPPIRKKERNEAESESLTQLRDTLLPKLISGELRIKDAEKFMERAESESASQAGSVS